MCSKVHHWISRLTRARPHLHQNQNLPWTHSSSASIPNDGPTLALPNKLSHIFRQLPHLKYKIHINVPRAKTQVHAFSQEFVCKLSLIFWWIWVCLNWATTKCKSQFVPINKYSINVPWALLDENISSSTLESHWMRLKPSKSLDLQHLPKTRLPREESPMLTNVSKNSSPFLHSNSFTSDSVKMQDWKFKIDGWSKFTANVVAIFAEQSKTNEWRNTTNYAKLHRFTFRRNKNMLLQLSVRNQAGWGRLRQWDSVVLLTASHHE